MYDALTVRDLPVSERPYEKCLKYGAQALTNAELIAAILRCGTEGEKSTDVALRVLGAEKNGILNLVYMDTCELMKIRGIGRVKAVQLKCCAEISKRIASAARAGSVVAENPASVADFYMERLRHEKKEIAVAAMFNTRGILLGDSVLSVGTSNLSLVSPRELFRCVINRGADSVILLHNHPSGDPTPSRGDDEVTRRVLESGHLLEIPLLDHIIIGDNRYFSYAEQGVL